MTRSADFVLSTDRLILKLPTHDAAPRLLAYYEANRDFHSRWDPPRPAGFYTRDFWAQRLSMSRLEYEDGASMRLGVFLASDPDGPMVGTANFTSIVRGPFQACRLGYGLGHEFEGQGYMSEALRAGLRHVFEDLRVHRVEANYVPTNIRSASLLRRLGFSVNGYARDYLYINGEWRDHVLTSLTSPNPSSP
jgi:[ribosomal protein S5]-alanine N-acetyltransferase